MLHMISQGGFEVTISDHGGQILSIVYNNTEYLWNSTSSNIRCNAGHFFPVSGPLYNDTYRIKNAKYKLEPFAFIKDLDLVVEKKEYEYLSLIFRSNEATRQRYPFDFLYRVKFRVVGARLSVTYEVENHAERDMYFSVGAQLCLRIPLDPQSEFDAYWIEFSNECAPELFELSDDGFVISNTPFRLEHDRRLPLAKTLFGAPTKLLIQIPSTATLRSRTDDRLMRFNYHSMRCFIVDAIETDNATGFLRLGFSTSMRAVQGVIEDITERPDIILLPKREIYYNEWSLAVE